jgi:hypothetical protein
MGRDRDNRTSPYDTRVFSCRRGVVDPRDATPAPVPQATCFFLQMSVDALMAELRVHGAHHRFILM